MVVDSKVFSFSGGNNERGRFLRIFESGGGYPAGGSSLMIAAGGQHSNLCAFGTCVHNVMTFINNGEFQVGDPQKSAGSRAGFRWLAYVLQSPMISAVLQARMQPKG